MPSILLLLRQTGCVCVCSKRPRFQRTGLQKNAGNIHFMFGGRFGFSQTGAEDGLWSFGGFLHQIKVRQQIHCKKMVVDFPVPSRDFTSQTLPGREKFNYSRPGRVWLVTSWLGTGKSPTFFYIVGRKVSLQPVCRRSRRIGGFLY